MTITIPAEKLPLILEYLNNPAAPGQEPPYGDGMDKILAAKIDDNGDIIAIGQDGSKVLAIKIGDKETSIRMANYEEQATKEQASTAAANFAQHPIGQESLITGIKQAGDEQIGLWLDQVKDMFLTADDPATAQAAVFELYPQLETAEFSKQTANYLTLAGLVGYFEAENE
jgi:phage gp29-like protein